MQPTFPPAPAMPDTGLLGDADMLSLVRVPSSSAAEALVQDVVQRVAPVADAGRKRGRGAGGDAKLRRAVGAILGGLLRSWASGAMVFRSGKRDGFTGSPVPFRQWQRAIGALHGLGLIGTVPGISFTQGEGFGDGPAFVRRAARYWPTNALLALAAQHGVITASIRTDFVSRPPATPPVVRQPIRLRELVQDERDPRHRQPLPIRTSDATAAAIRQDVEAHNAFAAGWRVEGCTPPRWCRLFDGGWPLHGRWYAVGADGAYQTMPEDERRAAITLNGERVVEIDVRASHLAILCARAGMPLPQGVDPYAVPGIPRNVVKKWIVATIGNGAPTMRAPKGAATTFAVVSAPKVAAAMIARHPVLADPTAVVATIVPAELADELAARHGVTARRLLTFAVMGVEATALTAAMVGLREAGVLALPMHDGLIVPICAADAAQRAMTRAFEQHAGFTPTLSLD